MSVANAKGSMENVLITGGTGYVGSYVIVELLQKTDATLHLLVRAKSQTEATEKLWKGLQMHLSERAFRQALPRFRFAFGDLTAKSLGLDANTRQNLVTSIDSILHIAASLNRKSEKACLNANLRGTLSVARLALDILASGRTLRRLSHVSTVAVAGQRSSEVVQEDSAIDWNRSDYDPYGRTKKFCEHMLRELLPNVPLTFFRPSIVMGDSRHARTTQFDMVRAFCVLADMRVLPLDGSTRLDIVNADYVGEAIAHIHMKAAPKYSIYHLSSGRGSRTAQEIAQALLRKSRARKPPTFVAALSRPFGQAVQGLSALANHHKNQLTNIGALLQVFWPYITYNTVFDNQRVAEELGKAPVPFVDYCHELYAWATANHFSFPYETLREPQSAQESHTTGDAETVYA